MNFLDRLQQSFADFWEYIPALLGAAVVLLAGYLLAKLVQKGAARLLRRLHLNDVLKKGGVVPLDRVSTHVNPTLAIANLLFWLVMFSALLLAANALGFDSLAALFSELVGYIPAVVAAVVIIIVGIVLGDFVGGLIGASTISLHGGPTLARVGKGGVVLSGVAAFDVTFQIDLNGKLPAGDYTVMALIAVNGNATNADIRRIPVQIASGG